MYRIFTNFGPDTCQEECKVSNCTSFKYNASVNFSASVKLDDSVIFMLLHSYVLLTIQNRYARLDHLIVTKIIELEFIDEKKYSLYYKREELFICSKYPKNICITYQNI